MSIESFSKRMAEKIFDSRTVSKHRPIEAHIGEAELASMFETAIGLYLESRPQAVRDAAFAATITGNK